MSDVEKFKELVLFSLANGVVQAKVGEIEFVLDPTPAFEEADDTEPSDEDLLFLSAQG